MKLILEILNESNMKRILKYLNETNIRILKRIKLLFIHSFTSLVYTKNR